MKDLQDRRDLLGQVDLPVLLDLPALLAILERGVLLVRLVCLELTASLDLLELQSCCLSASVRAEAIKVLLCLLRRLRQPPSCLRPGWL